MLLGGARFRTRLGPLPPLDRQLLGRYLDVGLLQVVGPRGEQVLSHLLVEVARVGNERRRQEAVPSDGGHLVLEGFAGFFPAFALSGQALQEGSAPVYLEDKQQGLRRKCPPFPTAGVGAGWNITGSRSQPEGTGVSARA